MSGDGHDDDDHFGQVRAAEWDRWRASHPIRPYAPAAGGIRDSNKPKPPKAQGAQWTTYRVLQGKKDPKVQQEWLYVPYATLVGGPGTPPATQPLAGWVEFSMMTPACTPTGLSLNYATV